MTTTQQTTVDDQADDDQDQANTASQALATDEQDTVDDQAGEQLDDQDQADGQGDEDQSEDEPETFPRDYVEKLRRENAGYRERAQRADDLAHRLHTALVTATGRLADPEDLPYDEQHLDDPEALAEALDGLLTRKPHLASRRPKGSVGQGATASTETVDLAGILRSRAG